MSNFTMTSYSVAGGGGMGSPNIGGWNTTLTDRSTQQQEVPGIKRREGANTYIYGLQGTNTITASGRFVILAAPLTDSYTDAMHPPIVFTALNQGTDNAKLVKGITLKTAPAGTYGWYFVAGITTANIGVASTTAMVGATINVSPTGTDKMVGGAGASAIGIALTSIYTSTGGLAMVNFQ